MPIIEAVVALAKNLGMTTTAEGVETVEQWRVLAAVGCTAPTAGESARYARPDAVFFAFAGAAFTSTGTGGGVGAAVMSSSSTSKTRSPPGCPPRGCSP